MTDDPALIFAWLLAFVFGLGWTGSHFDNSRNRKALDRSQRDLRASPQERQPRPGSGAVLPALTPNSGSLGSPPADTRTPPRQRPA